MTLVRWAIDRGGPGAKVFEGSTLVLYDCAVRPEDVSIEPGRALLVLASKHDAVSSPTP